MTRERISTMTRNGPPPEAAGALYIGEVMHQRLRPFGHRLAYRVFSLLVDIDRLDELDRMSPLFSVDAANLVAFRQSDHVAEGSVRAHADRLLAQAGLDRPAARILLLCYPRIFGYVFNPISVYFAYDDAGALVALIYAVRNTFGGKHSYVARIEPGDMSDARRDGAPAHQRDGSRRTPARRLLRRIGGSIGLCGADRLPLEDSADDVEDYGRNSLGGAEALAQGRAIPQEPARAGAREFR